MIIASRRSKGQPSRRSLLQKLLAGLTVLLACSEAAYATHLQPEPGTIELGCAISDQIGIHNVKCFGAQGDEKKSIHAPSNEPSIGLPASSEAPLVSFSSLRATTSSTTHYS